MLATTKPAAMIKSHASPDDGKMVLDGMPMPAGRRIPCGWITASNAIWFRPILHCSKLAFFEEALQISEKIFEMYPDGSLVWPTIPF
jgi:hypothetical protein